MTSTQGTYRGGDLVNSHRQEFTGIQHDVAMPPVRAAAESGRRSHAAQGIVEGRGFEVTKRLDTFTPGLRVPEW
jgi:hypothetical protein